MRPEAAIPDALFEHLKTLPVSPAIDIVWFDADFVPTVGQEFLEAQHIPNETASLHVGDGDQLYQGFLQVTVHYPRLSGITLPNQLAGDVIDHFRKNSIIDGDGVRIKIYRQPWAAQPIPADSWTRIAVSVPYRCNK